MMPIVKIIERRGFIGRAGVWTAIASGLIGFKSARALAGDPNVSHAVKPARLHSPQGPGYSFPAPSDVALYLNTEDGC